MKEGRNEVLKTDQQIEQEAKRKSEIVGIVISIICMILMVILSIPKLNKAGILALSMIFILLNIGILLLSKTLLFYAFKQSEYAKRSRAYVNAKICTCRMVEVLPNPNIHDEFIIHLKDIAKFYATMDKETDLIEIYIKFQFEENNRKYQNVSKEYFYDYYQVKEE